MRQSARAGSAAPEWPEGVRQISIEGLGLLGIDDDHQLYWDGQRVEVRRRLTLSFWQKFGAVIVVIATVFGGIGSFAEGYVAATEYGCKLHLWQHTCPPHEGSRPVNADAGTKAGMQ